MLVHTERGFMPENLARQRCHLQSVGVPTPKGPHYCAGMGDGWAFLPPSNNPSFPLSFWEALGLKVRAQKGTLNTHLAQLSIPCQGPELPFLSLTILT